MYKKLRLFSCNLTSYTRRGEKKLRTLFKCKGGQCMQLSPSLPVSFFSHASTFFFRQAYRSTQGGVTYETRP